MTQEQPVQVTETDITNTADKLAAFAQTLTPGEQAVLSGVIVAAAQSGQASSEVQGYFTLIPTASLLTSQGLRPALLTAFAMGDGSVRSAPGA